MQSTRTAFDWHGNLRGAHRIFSQVLDLLQQGLDVFRVLVHLADVLLTLLVARAQFPLQPLDVPARQTNMKI